MDGDGEGEFSARDAKLALEAVQPGDAEGLAGEEVEEDQEPDDRLWWLLASRDLGCVYIG